MKDLGIWILHEAEPWAKADESLYLESSGEGEDSCLMVTFSVF